MLTYVLFLDDSAPYQCHSCQCLRDSVGGNARDAEIQHDTFFILPPKDPINEILPTRPQDMDRAHGRSSHWHRSQYFSHFWLGYGRSIYSSLSLLTILFVPFILLYTHGSSAMGRFLRSPDLLLLHPRQGFCLFQPFPLSHCFRQRLPLGIHRKQFMTPSRIALPPESFAAHLHSKRALCDADTKGDV